jgi:hypothetical protein
MMHSERTATRPGWAAASAVLVLALLAVVPTSPSAGAQTGTGAWTIATVAGTGERGFSGDGGSATSARLAQPVATAPDARGNLYVAEQANNRIRKVDSSGRITTVAGTGRMGFSGDGGPATSARLRFPRGLAPDGDGNLFFADVGNHRIRKVDAAGIITTVAGTGARGFSGDGGPATSARLSFPRGLRFDAAGNLYLTDGGNARVRRIDTAGIITTVAGSGESGFSGDGGPATAANLEPMDVAPDEFGNFFIAEWNHRVRKVDAAGIITTVAGTGDAGFSGDGGPATAAALHYPYSVVTQGANLFILEYNNHAIRRVDASGTIHTVAGTPPLPGSHGDGGFAPYAGLRRPGGLGVDDAGNLFIADTENHRIRRVETSYLWISSAPNHSKVGETFTYNLNVSGLPATTTGVDLTASLAPHVAFVGATASQGGCGESAGTVTCQLGTVDAGAVATVEITVSAQGAGVVPITGTVSSEPEVIPGNRTATAYTKVSAANCGQTVSADTVLSENVGPCVGNGVLVANDAITLDLGGNRILGFDGPGDGHEAGIRIQERSGVTVTNGTVSGFDAGVVVAGGGSNTVAGMTIRDNVGPDAPVVELGDGIVLIESAGNFVHDNVVVNNGIYDGIGVVGVGAHNNTIERNTIEDTVGPSYRAPFGQGIIVNAAAFGEFTAQVISGTKINQNIVRNSGSAGIANINSVNGEILRNRIENNGHRNTFGNGIGVQLGLGLDSFVANLLIQGNEVHGNSLDGIQIPTNSVGEGADNNRILNNRATNNGRWDLVDGHPDCANNVWRNNTWGTGGYSPDCVTLGGKGPKVKAKGNPEQSAIDSREMQRAQPAPSVDELQTP